MRPIIRLQSLKLATETRIGRGIADSMRVEDYEDGLTRDIVLRIEAAVMTEELPPQVVSVEVDYVHPEAVGQHGLTYDPRHATWVDHLLDTHKGRWWARLVLRRRPVRYVQTPILRRIVAPVQCNHRASVPVRDRWTYPHASTVIPGYGYSVLRSYTREDDWSAEAIVNYGD